MRRLVLACWLVTAGGLANAVLPVNIPAATKPVSPAAYAPTPVSLLTRMAQAAVGLNYQGDLVYVHGSDVSSMRLTHVHAGDDEWEHVVKLDGHGAEVLRGGNNVIFRDAKGAATRMNMRVLDRTRRLAMHSAELDHFYIGKITDGSRIAGRPAILLSLQPRDQDRFGYEFYADKSTGLMLKSVMLDESGKALETFSFSSIRIGSKVGVDDYQAARQAQPAPTAPSAPRRATPAKTSSHPLGVAASALGSARPPGVTPAVETLPWQLWMPAGFSQLGNLHHKRFNGAPTLQVTYSDGLANFSVFAEQLGSAKPPAETQRQRGATAIVSRVRMAGTQAWLLTVVGELPLAVATHIADSSQPQALPATVQAPLASSAVPAGKP